MRPASEALQDILHAYRTGAEGFLERATAKLEADRRAAQAEQTRKARLIVAEVAYAASSEPVIQEIMARLEAEAAELEKPA